MKEIVNKIKNHFDSLADRKEIYKQADLLRQKITLLGKEVPDSSKKYIWSVNAGMDFEFIKRGNDQVFNICFGRNPYPNFGVVLRLEVTDDKTISINSLPHFFKNQADNLYRIDSGYFNYGGRYTSVERSITNLETQLLSEVGIPISESSEPNQFPKFIQTNKATLDVLKKMYHGEANFDAYIKAIQAAEVK